MDKGVPQARQGAKNVEVRSSMDYVCVYIYVVILVNALETLLHKQKCFKNQQMMSKTVNKTVISTC